MATLESTNVHPERQPGTWCVTLASNDDCRLAFNLPNKSAAEAARAELAPQFPGQRLNIGFFPTPEQQSRWAAEEKFRAQFDVDCGNGEKRFFNPSRSQDMFERAELLRRRM